MTDELRSRFGLRLSELRREKGLTQAQLAEKVGVSVDFISLVERGISAPSFDTLAKLAEVLQVPVAELFKF